jgi:hypothetical protein
MLDKPTADEVYDAGGIVVEDDFAREGWRVMIFGITTEVVNEVASKPIRFKPREERLTVGPCVFMYLRREQDERPFGPIFVILFKQGSSIDSSPIDKLRVVKHTAKRQDTTD